MKIILETERLILRDFVVDDQLKVVPVSSYVFHPAL
jgi:hypothetical protein